MSNDAPVEIAQEHRDAAGEFTDPHCNEPWAPEMLSRLARAFAERDRAVELREREAIGKMRGYRECEDGVCCKHSECAALRLFRTAIRARSK